MGRLLCHLLVICNWSYHATAPPFVLVRHELDILFLEDVSHVKEIFNFTGSLQEGFNFKVPTEGRNFNLHPVLV